MDKYSGFTSKLLAPLSMAIFFVILLLCCSYCIGFKEQVSLFYFGPGCLARYMHSPAVLSSIAGDLLTRFFFIEWIGVVICTLVLVLYWWGLDHFLKLTGAAQGSRIVALVPVAIECVFLAYPNHALSSTVGLVLAVWAANAVTGIRNRTVRVTLTAVCLPVLYILLGAPAVVFAILALLSLDSWKVRIAGFAAVLLAVPLLGRHYNLTVMDSFIYPAVQGYIAPSATLLALSYWFPLVPVLLSRLQFKAAVKYAVCILSIALVWFGKPGKNLEYSIEIGTHAYYGEWDKVRQMGSRNNGNRYGLYFYNLSYAREGTLPEHLLSVSQHMLSDGLFLTVNRGDSYLSSFYWPMALIEMGDFSQANDAALLGQTVMPGAHSSRMIRTLAEIATAAGDYQVAIKYLDILSQTPGHRLWASDLKADILSRNVPEKYLNWQSRAVEYGDRLYPQGDIRYSLKMIAQANPLNKVAADYIMCACLLEKNVNTFIGMYENWYLGTLDRFVKVPELYEQALLVNVNSNESLEETAVEYRISPETVARYTDFLSAQIKAGGNTARLERKYGDTYWYYLMSTTLVKNANTQNKN